MHVPHQRFKRVPVLRHAVGERVVTEERLRLLHIGHVQGKVADQVAGVMESQPTGSRWYALFPIHAPKHTAELRDALFELRKKGFNRLFQDGQTFEFSSPESLLNIDFKKPLFALVDRISIGGDLHQRLVDTTEICYRETGEVVFQNAGSDEILRFNEKFACKRCGKEFIAPEPSLFSFNSPFGACRRCQGATKAWHPGWRCGILKLTGCLSEDATPCRFWSTSSRR